MRCPKCLSKKTSVIDTRGGPDLIRRRRTCERCRHRFTTYERCEDSAPMVVKKDGRRESFDRLKVRSGLIKACEKRPVSIDAIDGVVQEIERRVCELGKKEVASRFIGELLIDSLRDLDQVAYVRFASVYREFSDIKQFMDTLQGLVEPRKRRITRKVINRRRTVSSKRN